MTKLTQHFIGINKRSEEIILRLVDLGATLMFYHHWQTLELNEEFELWDGEWMLHTSINDDYTEIEQIGTFLGNESIKDKEFNFVIVPGNERRV